MRVKTLVQMLFQVPPPGTKERFIAAGRELDVPDSDGMRMVAAGEAVEVQVADEKSPRSKR